jgi:hypothetical protein
MVSPRLQLVVLLIATLIFSAAQCVASCAAESSKPAPPPCHQHSAPGHQLAASCASDFLVPDAHRESTAYVIAIGLPITLTVASAPLFIALETTPFADFSPPFRILRI